MDRPILVPVRRMEVHNSTQLPLPGFISSENLFAHSPLFLQKFQSHNGNLESLALREPTVEIPVIKPRTSLSPQNNNYAYNNAENSGLAIVPRTPRTRFFTRDELIQVETHQVDRTPVPKPRPKSSISPLQNGQSPELSSWVQIDKNETVGHSYTNPGLSPNDCNQTSQVEYCPGSKRKMSHDDPYGYGGQVYRDQAEYRRHKKSRQESYRLCTIL